MGSLLKPPGQPMDRRELKQGDDPFDTKINGGVRCRGRCVCMILTLKEGEDVAGDALKVEDSTWDAEVMKASELVMVDFWAVWCGPCRMVAPVVDEIAREQAGKLKVMKLDVDENQSTAMAYGVMSIPTLILFKDGQPVERIVGFRPKSDMNKKILPHLG